MLCLSNLLGVRHSLLMLRRTCLLFFLSTDINYIFHSPIWFSFTKKDCVQLPAVAPKLYVISFAFFPISLAETEMTQW